MKRLFIMAAALAASLLPGCTSLSGLSLQSKDASPREAALILNQTLAPAVTALADACAAGVLGTEARAIVADYAPGLRAVIGAYATEARACVVEAGALRTDPGAGAACGGSDLRRVTRALPDTLKTAGAAIGGELGLAVVLAGSVATGFIGQTDGGLIEGYRPGPDVDLASYDRAWRPVQAAADRLAACVGER